MGKRGNNEGSVYFDASVGRYRAAVSLPNGRRKTVSGRTRAECASKLTQLQGRLSAGLPIESADQLSTLLDWWLSSLEAKAATETKSVNTVDNARWAVEKWIKPYVGGRRLRDLEPEDVERLLAAMARAGKNRRTVSRVKSYFGQALAAAERRGKVSRNVARLAEMPVTKTPPERRSLDPDQAGAMLEVACGHRLEALFVCALMLGLRPGELTGLRWADVDLENGTLQVAASMKRERGQLRLGSPKTARSRRTLSLPAPVLEALHVHELRQAMEQKEAGATWLNSGLVFTTEVGTGVDCRISGALRAH